MDIETLPNVPTLDHMPALPAPPQPIVPTLAHALPAPHPITHSMQAPALQLKPGPQIPSTTSGGYLSWPANATPEFMLRLQLNEHRVQELRHQFLVDELHAHEERERIQRLIQAQMTERVAEENMLLRASYHQ